MPTPAPDAASECASTHPLELIPYFRRFRQSVGRDLVYTFIWNTLIAIVFALVSIVLDPKASFGTELRATFVFAQCIGFMIHAGLLLGDRTFARGIKNASMAMRTAYYAIVPIIAIFPGYLLGFKLLDMKNGAAWLFTPSSIASILAMSLLLTGLMLLVFIPRERAARAAATIAREQARVAAAEKEAANARYQLLEAQVEPHFLYNTLAHVVSLVDGEPAVAKRMIERLIALLRATASAATSTGTLGGQVELLRAYLEILALRMGPRLDWRIDVPAELAALRVPPMLLQPLVENAIKHGLEPKVDGGALAVTARRDGARLLLEVADTGGGIRATRRGDASGLGLANLRARLAALYRDGASVTIVDNAPHGTRVTIALPQDLSPAVANRGVTAAAAASA